MTGLNLARRKEIWNAFNRWEMEQRWQTYHNMTYAKRFEVFLRMIETVRLRRPDVMTGPSTLAEWASLANGIHHIDMAARQ